jgi:hypothetical protein
MINYILIANTTVPRAIDYQLFVGAILALLVVVLYIRRILSRGCVAGGDHDWEYHAWNEPENRQVRWCSKCMVRQSRPSDEWGWGRDGLHVAEDDEL